MKKRTSIDSILKERETEREENMGKHWMYIIRVVFEPAIAIKSLILFLTSYRCY